MKVLILLLALGASSARADYYDLARQEQQRESQRRAEDARARAHQMAEQNNGELYAAIEAFARPYGSVYDVKPYTRENPFIENDEFINRVTFTMGTGFECVASKYGHAEFHCIHRTTGEHIDVPRAGDDETRRRKRSHR